MATTPIEVTAPSGLTLTADLVDLSDDSLSVDGGTCTEQTNAKGQFRFNHTGSETGVHLVVILSGATVIGRQFVNVAADDTTLYRAVDTYLEALALPAAAADAPGGLPISDAGGLDMDGLSTFDASTDEVTTDSASRTASQATGFATPTNVSDAQTAIINAVNAVNTGAARYISIATNAGYEIPDSGSVAYPIEVRTFDADGEPVAIDSAADPTVTVTRTTDAADLSGDLSAISNPTTGVYRMTLTVASTATVAPLRIDASGAIDATSRSTSAYPVITDAVAVDFTSADRTTLDAISTKIGPTIDLGQGANLFNNQSVVLNNQQVAAAAALTDYAPATAENLTTVSTNVSTLLTRIPATLFSGITSLASWLGVLFGKTADAGTLAEVNATTGGTSFDNTDDSPEAIRDRGDAAWTTGAGGGGGGGTAGPGSRPLTWITQLGGSPVVGVEGWISTDAEGDTVVGGTYVTDDSGIARVPGGTGLPMLDDDVVYYGWRDSATVQFATNPIQFRYSTDNSQWEIWNGTAYEEWT